MDGMDGCEGFFCQPTAAFLLVPTLPSRPFPSSFAPKNNTMAGNGHILHPVTGPKENVGGLLDNSIYPQRFAGLDQARFVFVFCLSHFFFCR
jgi:hypothetical protein